MRAGFFFAFRGIWAARKRRGIDSFYYNNVIIAVFRNTGILCRAPDSTRIARAREIREDRADFGTMGPDIKILPQMKNLVVSSADLR